MGYASFKTSVPFNLCKKAIDRGGTQGEPEVTGDLSYDGNGEITIPTSMGDVTIDLDTEEDWGDVNNKAKQNQVKKKFGELEEGRQKYREWQAKENKKIRDKYSLIIPKILLSKKNWTSFIGEKNY